MQEWWGVTDEVKRQANYLHEQKGYRVLIPDLYKGKIGVDAEEASHVSHASCCMFQQFSVLSYLHARCEANACFRSCSPLVSSVGTKYIFINKTLAVSLELVPG